MSEFPRLDLLPQDHARIRGLLVRNAQEPARRHHLLAPAAALLVAAIVLGASAFALTWRHDAPPTVPVPAPGPTICGQDQTPDPAVGIPAPVVPGYTSAKTAVLGMVYCPDGFAPAALYLRRDSSTVTSALLVYRFTRNPAGLTIGPWLDSGKPRTVVRPGGVEGTLLGRHLVWRAKDGRWWGVEQSGLSAKRFLQTVAPLMDDGVRAPAGYRKLAVPGPDRPVTVSEWSADYEQGDRRLLIRLDDPAPSWEQMLVHQKMPVRLIEVGGRPGFLALHGGYEDALASADTRVLRTRLVDGRELYLGTSAADTTDLQTLAATLVR